MPNGILAISVPPNVYTHATNHVSDAEGKMIKLSTMQKLFGLSLILSVFTIAVGMYAVSNLSRLSDDIDTLYSVHVKGLDAARAMNISALRILREEKNIILTNEDAEIQRYLDVLAKEKPLAHALYQHHIQQR